MSLCGSAEDLGRQQAEFILHNPTRANTSFLRRMKRAEREAGRSLYKALRVWNANLLAEAGSLAEALGVHVYSVLGTWTPSHRVERAGCTMLGVRGRDGCIAGRNFDLGFSGSDIRLIRCTPDSGIGSTGCGGWLGRYDGMNKAGLVAAMAVVEPPSRQQPEECSLPPSLVIRTLLDNARTTADAITVISDMGYWASVNYLLADAAGDVAIVESAPSRTSIRSSAGTVVATNHFQLAATARRDSLNRYDLALSEAGQHLTCALQMKQLLDQLGHPRLTRWQIVFMPSKKTLLFSGGYRASLLLMRV